MVVERILSKWFCVYKFHAAHIKMKYKLQQWRGKAGNNIENMSMMIQNLNLLLTSRHLFRFNIHIFSNYNLSLLSFAVIYSYDIHPAADQSSNLNESFFINCIQ